MTSNSISLGKAIADKKPISSIDLLKLTVLILWILFG